METGSAAEPLATVDAQHARVALSERVASPWWYQPLVGLLVAQHVAVQGARDLRWTLPSGVLLLGGCALLWLLWRHRAGITVPAWAGRRSLSALGLWSGSALVCVWAAAASREPRVVVPLAVVAAVGGVLLGRSYEAALRRDLARW